MERTRKRRLKTHAMFTHPVTTGGGLANDHTCQGFVGLTTRDLEQILPVFLFRIGINQDVLWAIMHAPQVARMLRVATAPFFG